MGAVNMIMILPKPKSVSFRQMHITSNLIQSKAKRQCKEMGVLLESTYSYQCMQAMDKSKEVMYLISISSIPISSHQAWRNLFYFVCVCMLFFLFK